MLGTLIDAATAAYAGAGAWQGRKRKLSGELSRLVGVGIAFLLGCGAFETLTAFTSRGDDGSSVGGLGFIGAFIGGLIGVRMIKRTLARKGRTASHQWLDGKISERTDRTYGMVAGGARYLILSVVVVSMAYLVPLKGLHEELFTHSFIGKAVGSFVLSAEDEFP